MGGGGGGGVRGRGTGGCRLNHITVLTLRIRTESPEQTV